MSAIEGKADHLLAAPVNNALNGEGHTMKGHATAFLGIAFLIWFVAVPAPAFAQQCNDVLGSLQAYSESGSAAGNFVGFSLSLFGQNAEQARTRAAAKGMQLLAQLMEQYGYNRQQAWTAFYQSPEGQRIMCVPGALSLLTDEFNAVMALPSGPRRRANPGRADQQPDKRTTQPDDPAGGEVAGTLTPPFLGPYRPNAYGPGINSDATGRPFVWQTDQGPIEPFAKVRPDVFGPGIGMDQYGRPVRAACPPSQPTC
jgi:hypothetical protein